MTKARDIASAAPAPSTVSATELGYLDGVSSAIQTQIDGKSGTAHNHDSAYLNQSVIDAKGDLLVGSADNAYARLAAGSNGETLVADSSATTGLRWQSNFAAGKNKIINGDFNIWQRGTSFSTFGYTSDRWGYGWNGGTGITGTVTRQTFTPGTAPVTGYEGQYFLRHNITNTGGAFSTNIQQPIEDVRTFAGQTITVSAWLKADTSRNLTFQVIQDFGSGGSSVVLHTGSVKTITTSWTRFSETFNIASIAGKTIGSNSALTVRLILDAANYTIDIWGVQAEAGNVATAFQTATGTLAGEYAAALRYYWRVTPGSSSVFGSGFSYNTTSSLIAFPYPVPMRVRPTALEQSGTASDYKTLRTNGAAFDNCTVVPVFDGGTSSTVGLISITSANVVSGHAAMMFSNSAGAYLGWSAEL